MFTICAEDDENSVWAIFQRLLESHEELFELKEMLGSDIRIAFMLRGGEWGRQGRTILGTCYCGPSAQGDLRPLFEQLLEDTLGYYPDFLIVLSGDFWDGASETEREVLVFHEAMHAGHATDQYGTPRFDRQTGRPVPCIRPHDIEEFNAVVRRYGAWKSDVAAFLEAAEQGARERLTPDTSGRDQNVSQSVSDSPSNEKNENAPF